MNWYWIIGIVGLVVAGLALGSGWRYVKSFYLISQISPYEQTGDGAGRILVLGDSTGYGTGASSAKDSIAGRIGAQWPEYTIVNDSVNGRKIADVLESSVQLEGTYELIVMQMGANDLLASRPVVDVVKDAKTLIEQLQPFTKDIVMLTSGNIGGAWAFSGQEAIKLQAASKEYRDAMVQLSGELPNFTYVDLYDEPAEDPFVLESDIYMALDGLHPSSAGYGLWYQKTQPAIAAALEKSD